MNEQKQTIGQTVRSVRYILGMIGGKKYGKTYLFLSGLLSLTKAIFPLFFTVIPGLIINELVGEQRLQVLAVSVAVLLLSPLVNQAIHIAIQRKLMKLTLVLQNGLEKDFYLHLSQVDFEYREDPEIGMKGGRAKDTLQSSLNITNQLFDLLSAVFRVLAILSIVSVLSPLIILMIVAIMFVNSIVTKKVNFRQHSLNIERDRLSRFELVFCNFLEQYLYAKEMKLFHLTDYMIKKKVDVTEADNRIKLKINAAQSGANVFYTCMNLLQQTVLYIYLLYNVLFKSLPVGSMTVYLTASAQFSGSLSQMFNAYLTLAGNSLRIQEMQEYLALPLRAKRSGSRIPTFDASTVIEFRDVSFRYPGSETHALDRLNLTIHGNEKLCIVGANGSGKTTFIKLLIGLYAPTEGQILLNGIDINEYDYQAYIGHFSSVFQDFQLFGGMTLGENIVLNGAYNKQKLDEVCKQSGVSKLVARLPKGYETYLDKWVDAEGIDPSGGEDQRIAIARACYHGGDVFLLDEPTAALDPNAEYEIYTQFNRMITDKCAVLITHRLSAVQLADKVAVFEEGHVVEYGTHKELYAKGGLYTEMFDKQAQFYREENPAAIPAP